MKKKRFLGKTGTRTFLFGMLAVMLSAGPALFAQSAESNFEVALTDDGNGVVIKKFIGTVSRTITIPATIEGLPVREIGSNAFYGVGQGFNFMGRTEVGTPFTVVLPAGLAKIGDEAFSRSGLTSVVIPDSVTEIGMGAFQGCFYYVKETGGKIGVTPTYSLTSVTLSKGLTKIWGGGAQYGEAFAGNSALKTVVIPEGLSVLGESMFSGCTSLTEITIPKSITVIPERAFSGCSGLKTLVIPEGVAEISSFAFSDCTALTSVTIPSTITTIERYAFRDCSALTTVTFSDPDLAEIKSYAGTTLLDSAFEGCGKLNLATQARLRKIRTSNMTRYEAAQAAQKQREAEEREAQTKREEEERLAEVKREREEQAAQAQRQREEREAQVRREREAEVKRRQEEEEARQAKLNAELQKIERGSEIETALMTRLAPMQGTRKLNKQQFAEFMNVYGEYDAAKKQGYNMSFVDSYIQYILLILDKNQKKQFDAKFK
jgi:hypothetical protein